MAILWEGEPIGSIEVETCACGISGAQVIDGLCPKCWAAGGKA